MGIERIDISPYIREGSGLKRASWSVKYSLAISPYIREGSGLKHRQQSLIPLSMCQISPYIREGSGLKLKRQIGLWERGPISPYIREGSGLKPTRGEARSRQHGESPLTSVRGAD